MKLYIEFAGTKLSGTECVTYQEAKFMVFKIIDQCILNYRNNTKRKILATEEMKLQSKIMSKLKLKLIRSK